MPLLEQRRLLALVSDWSRERGDRSAGARSTGTSLGALALPYVDPAPTRLL
jgi:hypothetical protein